MQRMKLNFGKFSSGHYPKLATVAFLLMGCFPASSLGQQKGQKTFSSPEEASNALLMAIERNDEKTMLEILGPEGKQIVSSGDEAEDAESRANFVQKYREMHRLVTEPDRTVTLYIGAENWPTPIPLLTKGKLWYFDTEAGKREILYRRIGRNELSAIRVCQELVAAEKEYYSAQHDEYARKIFSDEGQHNGLYWKATDGGSESPIGPLVASAVADSNSQARENTPPTPYRGYYFHMLAGQGKNSQGGPKSYIVNGKMTEGFAFVAYPAEYRSSGVVTFLVDAKGVVYEKDLGKKTEVVAKSMKEFDPHSGWRKTEDLPEEIADEQKPK